MSRQAVPISFRSCVSEDGTRVSLSHRALVSVPEWLRSLTGLTALDLRDNELTTLPEWIGDLTALTALDLRGNQLTALPDTIGNLTALAWLHLDVGELTALPDVVGNLTALTALDLRAGQLTALPDTIGNLTSLTALYLRGGQLTALPETIGNLTALTILDLGGNQLTALPDTIGNLTGLTTLDLGGNQLTRLPKQLAELLVRGLHLSLSSNPLADPLPELTARGADALAAYLGSLEDATPQYEAKLILVGEGKVGKTSLVAALIGNPFVEERATTHGIEVSSITFRHPIVGRDMTLRAWDFGGQEVYRVTHQFFFSGRALYLVVWDARQGQEQNGVEGWLRRIRLRVADNARTIVVATHCAERLPELDYRHLEQAFSGMLAGRFEVENSTGDGISELRQAISHEAAQLPQMGQWISNRWATARDQILGLAQTDPQITYERFVAICRRHGVTDREMVTLVQLMHDLGQIIYYGEDEGLKDIVVLNPEWLTKAISYVLEDKPTKDSGGILDHARLKDIWQGGDKGSAYPARYHPYFLRLMEKFDISYRLEGDELHSLVAQRVPYERPVLPWESKTQPPAGIRTLALVCRLSEAAAGLIPWLTVRHHRASIGMHWQHGVFLRHPISAYASEAFLELRHPTELTIEVRAPSPDLYFNVLRDSVEDLITRRWPGLQYQFLIPCPGKAASGSICQGHFPLENLLRMRERGRTTVPCWECTEDYEISRLLTGFTVPSQPLAEQLTRIEKRITRVEYQSAEIADSVRRVMRVVSTEVTDCPRLFTIKIKKPTGPARLRPDRTRYLLTLWCEYPGYWHPLERTSYRIDEPKEWFLRISPYATLVFRTLQLVVPIAGSAAKVLIPPAQLRHAQAELELMGKVVSELPDRLSQSRSGLSETSGKLAPAEGEALRAIRAILFERDRLRVFGGLRRVRAESADFLWVCPDHYPQYDPGLPKIP
jgi:internalin A